MVTIGKKQSSFRCSEIQMKTHSFQISVDILRNTNFFRAFFASASVPAIYIQQFLNSMKYDEKTEVYCCQVDEQWFNLSADLFRKALDITPIDPAHPFELPFRVGKTCDVHKRPESPCHLSGDDFLLGNLKFISKGETSEVFGMAIHKQLITQAIQQYSYYPKYLEMVAKNTKKTPQDSASKQPEPATKLLEKGKPSVQLVDDDDEAQMNMFLKEKVMIPVLESGQEDEFGWHQEKARKVKVPMLNRTSILSLAWIFLSANPRSRPLFWRCSCTSEKVGPGIFINNDQIRTESETEALLGWGGYKGDKEQGEVASSIVTSGVGISVRTEDPAGSDPRKAHEALAGPDPEPMQGRPDWIQTLEKNTCALWTINPEHIDEEFLATAYPKVHENLKLITDERVIEDNPESHSGSMSSMKNLEDTDNFGDQFLNDKPPKKRSAITSPPPLIAPVIDFSSPKPSSQVTHPPINKEATSITTTLLEITPFIALQLRVAKLEQDMSEVNKTNHSAAVLASIKSQVPTVVDKYLGTNDALLRPDDDALVRRLKTGLKTHKRIAWIVDDERRASRSAQPPPKNDEQSSKKLHDSDASASKQNPSLTLIGWQITELQEVTEQKKKLSAKSDLEGPAFNLVKAFHKNNVFLQFQMDDAYAC
ncbi:hypothetical protein Tco_1067587 [Tanacetum coccineum]|uniref:Uncharacterized protein n=1 Tax=Tanacetum coccineum TaxID=301880 RepID=A0ABQ5HDW0_9ASTR